jgi:pSer/pThr/pTyr-binding forkhead associated (FHA) protein/tetratricopeptide (TPR) repeat protein
VVGRSHDVHLVLDNVGVSREHAYFYVSDGELVVEDAGSAAGTIVDEYIIEEPLYVGPDSVVEIGSFTIEIQPGDADTGASVAVDSAFVADAAAAGEPAMIDEDNAPQLAGYEPTIRPGGGLLKLAAISGINAGQEVPLSFPEDFDIGRDEKLEIAVMDPTVSRRHARLRQTDNGVLVIDLRSANGTYINGERVKRQEAVMGDRLRFGEVAYELQHATAKEMGGAEKPRIRLTPKHMVLIGGGTMLVLGMLILGLMSGKPRKRKQRRSSQMTTSTDSKLQLRFRKSLATSRTFMEKRQWLKAREALEPTKNIFARHTTRDGLLRLIEEELQHREILKKANALYAGGTTLDNYEKARTQYMIIKPTSDYFSEAQFKLGKVKLWLAKYYLTEGMTYHKSRRRKNQLKAARFMCKYFRYLPEFDRAGGSEEKHREILVRLEKKVKRVKSYIACDARRFKKPQQGVGVKVGALAEIKKQHQIDRLVKVMMLYHKGNLDSAINRLQKVQQLRSMRKHRVTLTNIFNKLTVIKGQYSAGTSALQTGKLNQAQAAFDKALAVDAEITPPTLQSYIKIEIGRQLAEAYLALGQKEYKRSRYEDAYLWWSKGKAANPNHQRIVNAVLKLESIARNWVSEAASLVQGNKKAAARAKYESVRRITEPGSLYYTKATTALANLQ